MALPPQYSLFGQATSGTDVIDKIGVVQTATGDKPVKDVKIEKFPGANNFYAIMNLKHPPFSDVRVRKAVKMLVEVMHAASRGKSAANDGRFS